MTRDYMVPIYIVPLSYLVQKWDKGHVNDIRDKNLTSNSPYIFEFDTSLQYMLDTICLSMTQAKKWWKINDTWLIQMNTHVIPSKHDHHDDMSQIHGIHEQ